jgi:uncharacterized membrane protein YkoI
MPIRMIPIVLSAIAVVVAGCQGNSGPGSGDVHYDPPTTEFATTLGISTPPPVTSEEAMAIAAEAAGGTALSVDQENEGGQLLYEVRVETPNGRKEVEVRASDGAVVEIEADDGD